MNNKLARILLSVVIAFGLWLYVITVESPNSEVTINGIPVSFQNESFLLEERNLILTTENVPTVSLTLQGSRSDLNKLSSGNVSVTVDLLQVYEPGEQQLTYRINYPENVSGGAYEELSRSPNQIVLEFEKRVERPVPVEVVYVGNIAEEYKADITNPELSRDTVLIKGPGTVIDEIAKAVIEVDLNDRKESIAEVYEYTLCNANNDAVDAKQVVTDVAEIEFKLKIQRIQEIPLVVTIVDGGGATRSTSKIAITPKTIKVAGSDTVLAELKEINIGTINLADQPEDTELTFDFTANIPDNVTNETGVTSATVSLKFPDLKTRTFTITNIVAENVPEGFTADLVTQALTVDIRGPKAQMDAIKESDISAVVDFTNAQAGSTTYKAEIVISQTYPGVGAIGTPNVSATLRVGAEANDE